MSRRISQKRRQGFSDALDVTEQEVVCDQDIRTGPQPRRLIYRRLKGLIVEKGGVFPKRTNIACWYCRLSFKTQPIPIVQQYDATKNVYDVYGVACSGPCSKSYIMSLRNNDARTRLMWQTKMLIEVFGWPPDEPVPAANPWQALDVFGGYMNVDEWRRVVPDIKMQIKMPPFVPFVIFTETEMKGGVCQVDQTKPMEAMEHVDTLEEQAMQHGAAFSLKGLKRPEAIISTVEQLAVAHPHHAVDISPHGSVFGEFLATQTLPTPEECQDIRDQREADRKAKRKRKKPVSAAAPTIEPAVEVYSMESTEPEVASTHPRSPRRRVTRAT
jgi:hypothetical protein